MDEQKFSFSGSYNKAKEYIDTQIELVRLKAIARASRIMGSMIVDMSKLLLGLIVVFFLSLALGFYLGELMGSNALGFLTTGGIFLVLLLLIRVFEPQLEAKFMDMAIRKTFGKWNQEDEVLSSMDQQINEEKSETESIINEQSDERKDQ